MAEPRDSLTQDPLTRDPLALLLEEVGRDRTGEVRDAAQWAAVVGVERVSLVAGTDDPGQLRQLLQGRTHGSTADAVSVEVRRAWGRVAEALERGMSDRGPDAGTAHREAGRHSVTTDAVRLRAAIRAAHRTFEAEPYYRARYADRGARFAGSDSAWLVTLADLPADGAVGQAAWLAKVLAGRGMPTWLLGRHLVDLAEELSTVGCEPGALVAASGWLADTRRSVLDDARLVAVGDELRAATGHDEPLPGAAALVLAAAADVATGLAASYDSCVGWLTDETRCAPVVAAWLREQADRVAPRAAVSAGRSRAGSPGQRS